MGEAEKDGLSGLMERIAHCAWATGRESVRLDWDRNGAALSRACPADPIVGCLPVDAATVPSTVSYRMEYWHCVPGQARAPDISRQCCNPPGLRQRRAAEDKTNEKAEMASQQAVQRFCMQQLTWAG